MQHQPAPAFANVSGRWLLSAFAIMALIAAVCAWLALCLLYWQGSWQLLYHPKAEITRTPASAGLTYETVHFEPGQDGAPELTGWWMPAPNATSQDLRFTILYLHGADGNLSNTVDTLAALHRAGLAVFAIDYRGYGASRPARPSEAGWREDADHALDYLQQTRHVALTDVIVYGEALGADLAAEVAAEHNALAGVVLDQPRQNAVATIFADSRSRLVPARSLVKDRYDLTAAAVALRVPSLWIFAEQPQTAREGSAQDAYKAATGRKSSAWLTQPSSSDPHFLPELKRWRDDLKFHN